MYDEPLLEERVDSLESILGRFIVQTETSLNRLSREMQDFKKEMSDFKKEMSDFKKEMSDFKDEMRQDRRMMNRQWGDLANKMGTIVEDIVAPAVRPVITKYFDCEVTDFMISRKRKNKPLNLAGEFDVIAVSDDRVFAVETKSSPNEEYLYKFIDKIEIFKQLFPEYGGKQTVPIFASLRFDEELIQLASVKHIYVLAYREWDYMDILNFEEVNAEKVRSEK